MASPGNPRSKILEEHKDRLETKERGLSQLNSGLSNILVVDASQNKTTLDFWREVLAERFLEVISLWRSGSQTFPLAVV